MLRHTFSTVDAIPGVDEVLLQRDDKKRGQGAKGMNKVKRKDEIKNEGEMKEKLE